MNKRYRANPDFLMRTIAGETLLMPTGSALSGMMLPLSETAAFLWQLLQEPKSIEDVILAAKEEYADEEGILESSIREFIETHVKSGLILEEK